MNYGSLRHYLKLRYLKAPDGDGAGGGGSSPGSDTGGSSVGGDSGGGSSVATPGSDGGSVSPASPSPDSNSDPWANLGSLEDLDHIEVPAAPAAAAPPSPTPVPPVAPTPAQPAPPAQPQPQQPGGPTPQNPQPQTPPAQAATPPQVDLSPSDPAGMAAAMEQNMPALLQHLAQERFALTQEQVQELETDVTTAVPKLLANVYLQNHIAMQKFLAQAVPGMIQRHTQVSQANTNAENKFFDTHKQLGLDKNNEQHRQVAVRTAKLYRQMYPQASLDQLISDIGPMVASAVRAQGGGVAPQPQAGASPTVVSGGVPFRPAVNGGGSPMAPQQPALGGSDWSALGQDFD